jgi:hypothetical protein
LNVFNAPLICQAQAFDVFMAICLLLAATMLYETVEVDDGMIHEWLHSVVSSGGIPGDFIGYVRRGGFSLAVEELCKDFRIWFDVIEGRSKESWLASLIVHLGRIFLGK